MHIAAAFTLALVSFSGGAQAQQGISKTEVVLGTVQDLSGPLATLDQDILGGMKMRLDEINAQEGIHGRTLRLITEDNGYDPRRSVLATQKLVNRDKIFAMVGLLGSAAAIASMPVLLEKNVLSFMPLSSAREMFDPPHRLKFAFSPSYFDGMKLNAPRVYQLAHATKACILYQDDELGLEVLRGAEAGLKTIHIEIAEKTSYKRGATDFSSQIARLKGANCDYVILGTVVRETVGAITEARKLGFNPTFHGSASVYSDVIPKLGGKAMDGLYADMYAQFPYLDDVSPDLRAWANRYKTQLGTDPTVFSAYGYLIIDRFADALWKTGPNLTLDSFIKTMESTTIPPDIFGNPTLTYTSSKRLGSSQLRISQLENSRWKVIMDYPRE